MTRNNEPSYRKKGLSVFLVALMVLSVVAMTAFVAPVAAVNEDGGGSPSDVAVGVEDTSQTIEGIDVSDGDANVTIDISALADVANMSNVDDDSIEETTSFVDETHYNASNSTIVLEDTGSSSLNDGEIDIRINNINTSETDTDTGLTYEVTQDNTETSESFDLIDAGFVVDLGLDQRTLMNEDVDTFDDAPDLELTLNVSEGAEDQTLELDLSDLEDAGVELNAEDLADAIAADSGDLDGHSGIDGADVTATNDSYVIDITYSADDITGSVEEMVTISLDHSWDTEDLDVADGDEVLSHVATDGHGNEETVSYRAIEVTNVIDTDDDNVNLWHGEDITLVSDNENDVISIYEADGEEDATSENRTDRFGTTPGQAANYDTSELDGDTVYQIELWDHSGTPTEHYVELTLDPLDLQVELADDEIDGDEELQVNVTTEDFGGSDVIATVYDDDDDPVATATEELGGSGDAEITWIPEDDFDDFEEGDFYVEVEHEPSGVTAETDTVEVGEAPEPDTEVSFGDMTDAAEGDYAEIEFEFEDVDDYDEDAILFWINESDYNLNATLELGDFENDSVTMLWNTEKAGQEGEDAFEFVEDSVNLSVDIHDETDIDSEYRLNPGGYDFSVFDDGTGDNVQDTDSLTVSERSTGDITSYIAPSDEDDYDDNLNYILDNATSNDEVANGDVLIIAQEVNGIFGEMDEGQILNEEIDNALPDGIYGNFSPSEAPAYQAPSTFQYGADNVTTFANSTEGVVYFVYDVDVEELDEGDSQEWDFTFNVTEDFTYIEDEDDEESSELTYTVNDRSVTLDKVEDPYQVTPTEDGVISGSSTLAPGSNLTINVAKSGTFSDTVQTTQVGDDGNWTMTYDFSDRSVGEEFTITISAHDVDEEEYEAIFDDTPEADTVADVDALEEQIEDLEDQLADAESENDDLQDALDAAEADNEDLQAANEDLQANYDGAQEDIADLEGQVDDLTTTNSELEDEIVDLEDQIDELQDEENPAFGPIAALFALLAGGAIIARRRLN